jgi:hypothetical protein
MSPDRSSKSAGDWEEAEIVVDGKSLESVLKSLESALKSLESAQTSAGLVRSGRGFKADWVRLSVEALKLRRDFPDATAHKIALELDQMLLNSNQKQPATGKLYELVNGVFTYDDNPLPRPPDKDSKLKQDRKRQKGK